MVRALRRFFVRRGTLLRLRAPAVPANALLTEGGDVLTTEGGDALIVE